MLTARAARGHLAYKTGLLPHFSLAGPPLLEGPKNIFCLGMNPLSAALYKNYVLLYARQYKVFQV